MSNDKSPILYRPDYIFDPENQTTKRYYVLDQNGNKEQFTIALWDGTSIEAFLAHNVKELENYFECLTTNNHPCTYATRFKSLGNTLVGDALINWDELVEDDYPHVADKTQANYEKAIKDLITKLSDITYPGEPMKDFMKKINYFRCKDDEGNLVPPNKVLSRFKRMRNYGDRMHHTAPAGQPFISDIDFLKMYYDVFPLKMKNFVTEVKGCDPFNGITTVDEIGQFFYSYYKLYLKNEKEHTGKRKRDDEDKTSESESENENKTSESENEDKTSENEDKTSDDEEDDKMSKDEGQESSEEEEATDEEDNDKSPSSKKDNDKSPKKKRKGTKGDCPIRYHAENWFHSWTGCFCNPDSAKFDRNGADKFYNKYATDDNSWYKHVYEAAFGEGGQGNPHFNNRGEDYNGHGNERRGNGGRGNDDSSHYNQDNSYHYQGDNYYQGQHHSYNGWRR